MRSNLALESMQLGYTLKISFQNGYPNSYFYHQYEFPCPCQQLCPVFKLCYPNMKNWIFLMWITICPSTIFWLVHFIALICNAIPSVFQVSIHLRIPFYCLSISVTILFCVSYYNFEYILISGMTEIKWASNENHNVLLFSKIVLCYFRPFGLSTWSSRSPWKIL